MAELFIISDTHFGHGNILKFEHDGKPLRPFQSLTEMHIELIDRWNSVVGVRDKVYHLGDVAFTREGLNLLGLLNGKKRLIRGNHDGFKLNEYRKHFDEVYGVRQIDGYWFSHCPMHPQSVGEPRVKANVHGHLHAGKIDHPKYFNACVEHIDYTPVAFDTIKELYSKRGNDDT